jgi:hypothetical protein
MKLARHAEIVPKTKATMCLVNGKECNRHALAAAGGGGSNPYSPLPLKSIVNSIDAMKQRMLALTEPIERAYDRGCLEQARNLFAEKIALAEQLVDCARRKGSRQDIEIFEKGVELYNKTYAKLVAEWQQPQGQGKAYQLNAELQHSDQELAKLLSLEPKSPKTTILAAALEPTLWNDEPERATKPADEYWLRWFAGLLGWR